MSMFESHQPEGPGGAGFGTIDVLVALGVLSFGLVAITGLLVGSISTGATAEASSIASNLARERLEEAHAIVAQAGLPSPAVTTAIVRVPPGGRTYTVTTTFSDLGNNVANIQVNVVYQVTYGSACAATADGAESCSGAVRHWTRSLETRVRRP